MHLLFLLSKPKWLPRLALLLVSLGSLGCLKSKSHPTKPQEQVVGNTGQPQAKAWESKFDLNLSSLAEAHPQTKQILESNIENLPERPLRITSSLVSPKGQVFYFTKIIQGESDQRHLVIMFTKNKTGLFVPRLLYKSQSDGSWMVSPTNFLMFGDLVLIRGEEIHFTQETKVIEEIINHLDKAAEIYNLFYSLEKNNFKNTSATIGYNFFMLKGNEDREKIFNYKLNKEVDNIAKGVYTYEEEVKKFPLTPSDLLKKFQDCQPNSCFAYINTSGLNEEKLKIAKEHNSLDATHFENLFKSFTYPDQFLPDFSLPPTRIYQYNHSLAGTVTVEVLPAKLSGQNIEWHFARDNKGRIWIDRINLAERNINSYGILTQVIDSGLLTNRQVEYKAQSILLWKDPTKLINGQAIKGYIKPDGEETSYMDLSPLLDLLKPIEEFRKARKITRTK